MRTILLLCLSILFLPLTLAAEGLTVAGGTLDTDYSYKDNVYTVLTGTKLTFSGTTTVDRIVIAKGVTADITLSDLSIDVSEIYDAAAIRLEKKVKLTLHITGTESTLKSGDFAAGIGLSDECDLHITAKSETPKLTVFGGYDSSWDGYAGAAIGGNLSEEGKASIRISNGTISATGGACYMWGMAGDGIGQSGDRMLQMAIVLDGGKITAKGGTSKDTDNVSYDINGNVTINSGIFTNCTIFNIIKLNETNCTFTDCALTFKTPVTLTRDYSGCTLSGDITIVSGSYTNCTLKDNIVINDGTFTNCSISGTKAIINKGTITNCPISGTKLIINKGTINNTDGSQITSNDIIINGGDIKITIPKREDGYGIHSIETNKLTIYGGNIFIEGQSFRTASSSYKNKGGNAINATETVEIYGGTINLLGGSGSTNGGWAGPGLAINSPKIIIDGGSLYAKCGKPWGDYPFEGSIKNHDEIDIRLGITPEIENATDVSVDGVPYYISGNHPEDDNKLYLYMTGSDHTITVRTENGNVTTYTATYNSKGVDGGGYFSFKTGSTNIPSDNSVIAFEVENITTTYNKESNTLKVTLTVTEPGVKTRSAAMNSVQLALSDGTTTYYSDRQTVTGSGKYEFTFDTKELGAGEYTLTANYGGSATSLAATEQTKTLTIEQAEGSTASDYKEPNTLTATYGQTLADVTLPASWAWNAPGTSVGNVSSSPNTFAATFTPADTKNYKTVSKVLSVTVNKATASDPGTPAVLSPSPVTYGTKLSDITITAGWQWEDGAIVPTIINSGYTASFSVTDDTNYDWSGISDYDNNTHQVIRTVTVTVSKADLTADYFTFTAPTNLVYDGQAKAATVTAKDGLTGVGAITIKYYKDGATEVSEPTEVGTYTVKIDVAEGDNCKSTSDLTTPEWTFTILPKSDPPVNPPDDPDDPDEPAPVHYTVTLPAIEGAITDPAAGSYEVESWGSFSFLLTLDEGYRTDSHPVVTARGETLTPNASTGKYTIQHVRSDITVEITGIVKDVATGNETLSDGFHITTSGRLLLVTVPRAIRLYLTDTSGRLILTRQLPAGDTRIDDLAAGVYLLTLEGEKTKKIIIR